MSSEGAAEPGAADVPASPEGPGFVVRAARFEDVSPLLRLIAGAIERGCRSHYKRTERRAVLLSYAQHLFLDVIGPFITLVAEREGTAVGLVQIDVVHGRLRGLFVAADVQARGLGRALLARAERVAVSRGCRRLTGAMSLNAIRFYARAGYVPCAGARVLELGGVPVEVAPMHKLLDA